MSEDEETQIVKVYRLDGSGAWVAEGIGQFIIDENNCIKVSEEQKTLLMSPIIVDDVYRVANELILMWYDAELKSELALSFQSKSACLQAMKRIDDVRSTLGPPIDSPSTLNPPTPTATATENNSFLITFENISELHADVISLVKRGQLLDTLSKTTIIPQLLKFFPSVVNQSSAKNVSLAVEIIRLTLTAVCQKPLGTILQQLMGTFETVMSLIHVLEHDSDINPQHIPHISVLQNRLQSIESKSFLKLDEAGLCRMKYVFALGYLRESVAPRVMEDDSIVGGQLPLHVNRMRHELFRSVFSDSDAMRGFMSSLDDVALGTLYEVMTTMKTNFFPMPVREEYAVSLFESGFMHACIPAVTAPSIKTRSIVADMLFNIAGLIPMQVRAYFLSRDEEQSNYPWIYLIIQRMMTEPEEAIAITWKEMICVVLTPPPPHLSPPDFTQFRNVFFDSSDIFNFILKRVQSGNASKVTFSFLSFVASQHWNVASEKCLEMHTLADVARNYIVNPKMPIPKRLSACDFIRTACTMSSSYEIMTAIQKDGVLGPLIECVASPRANSMLTCSVMAIFQTLHNRKMFGMLNEVAKEKCVVVQGTRFLQSFFESINPTVSDDGSNSASSEQDNREQNAEDEERRLLECIEEGNTSVQEEPQAEIAELPKLPAPVLAPEMLATIAGLCRKRMTSNDDAEDEEIYERLLKKR